MHIYCQEIEDDDVEIYVPKVCVVETAAVIRRLANKTLSVKISKGILDSYEVIDEMLIFDSAWKIAVKTGCSGFDSYFIALAKIKNAVLLTDDGGSNYHAKETGVDSILIRNTEFADIEKFILE
jgi:predicted nucleic acid-binding protein